MNYCIKCSNHLNIAKKMIKEEKTDKDAYKSEREKHIKMLKDYETRGHEHPKVEGD